MRLHLKILIAALILVVVALSCNLPTPSEPPSPPQPDPTAPIADVHEPDFSQVRLELADLPQGFTPVDPQELTAFGIDFDSFLASISAPLAKAEPQNLAVYSYVDGVNSTLVISFIVQPLTLLERGAFDLLARDPQQAVNLFANSIREFSFTPQTSTEPIGDAVIATAFTFDRAEIHGDGELILSRRDRVVQVAMVNSLRGGSRAVSGLDVARIIDEKIKAAQE